MTRTLALWLLVMIAACVPAPLANASVYSDAVLADNPVAYYRLGETALPTAFDAADAAGAPQQGAQDATYVNFGTGSGSGNIGQAGPRPGDTAGGSPLLGFDSFNRASHFEGPGGTKTHVEHPDHSSLDITGGLSLEAWVNADGFSSNNQGIVAKYVGAGNNRAYNLFIDNQSAGANHEPGLVISPDGTFASAAELISDSPLPTGEWVHLVATYEPGTSMRIYRNGALDTERTTGVPASIANTTAPLWIGPQYAADNDLYFFDGLIDEVAVYDYALSAGQVAGHFLAAQTAPPPPTSPQVMMHLPLDETTGTVATDATGRGNDGTLNGAGFSFDSSSAAGPIGTALDFNGSSDGIYVANADLPSPTSGDAFTVTFWAQVADWDGQHGMFANYSLNDLQFSLGLHDTQNGLVVGVDTGTNSQTADDQALFAFPSGVADGTTLTDGQFAHFAAVFDTSGPLMAIGDLYINGVAQSEDGDSYWWFNDPGLFTIGRRDTSVSTDSVFLDGVLDDFAIFGRALSASEVGSVMDLGVEGFAATQSVIPEPSSAVIFATLGLVAALARVRRHRTVRR